MFRNNRFLVPNKRFYRFSEMDQKIDVGCTIEDSLLATSTHESVTTCCVVVAVVAALVTLLDQTLT